MNNQIREKAEKFLVNLDTTKRHTFNEWINTLTDFGELILREENHQPTALNSEKESKAEGLKSCKEKSVFDNTNGFFRPDED